MESATATKGTMVIPAKSLSRKFLRKNKKRYFLGILMITAKMNGQSLLLLQQHRLKIQI
jgi:hypothetical protein